MVAQVIRLARDPERSAPVFRRDKRKSAFARRSSANNELKRDCLSTWGNRVPAGRSTTTRLAPSIIPPQLIAWGVTEKLNAYT